jgi:hypothetical protein
MTPSLRLLVFYVRHSTTLHLDKISLKVLERKHESQSRTAATAVTTGISNCQKKPLAQLRKFWLVKKPAVPVVSVVAQLCSSSAS